MTMESASCDKCGNIDEPFWRLAERKYCRACVRQVAGNDAEPLAHPLVEEIRRSFLAKTDLWLWSGFVWSSLLSSLIVAIFVAFILIYMLATIEQPQITVHHLFFVTLLMAGGSFTFFSIICFPLILIGGALTRPFRISTQGDTFFLEGDFGKQKLSMEYCYWMTPSLACDGLTFFLPSQRLILVEWIDTQRRVSAFACGFTNESYRAWQSFLRMRGIPFKKQIPLTTWVLKLMLGAGVGVLAGILVGVVPSILDGNRLWISSFGFLGFLNGFIWAMMHVLIAHSPTAVLQKSMRSNRYWRLSRYCLFPLSGFVIGLTASVGGWKQGLIVGAGNSLVFGWMAWSFWCAYRDRLREELEHDQGDLTYSAQKMS